MLTPGGGRRGPGLWESSQVHLCRPAPCPAVGGGGQMEPLGIPGCLGFSACLGNLDNPGQREDEAGDEGDPECPAATVTKGVDCFCPSRGVLGARSL